MMHGTMNLKGVNSIYTRCSTHYPSTNIPSFDPFIYIKTLDICRNFKIPLEEEAKNLKKNVFLRIGEN
jgi:hypothetical protein